MYCFQRIWGYCIMIFTLRVGKARHHSWTGPVGSVAHRHTNVVRLARTIRPLNCLQRIAAINGRDAPIRNSPDVMHLQGGLFSFIRTLSGVSCSSSTNLASKAMLHPGMMYGKLGRRESCRLRCAFDSILHCCLRRNPICFVCELQVAATT